MINYEEKIDFLNENTQLDFLQYSIDTIGLQEGIDIKGKAETIKNTVIKFFNSIREKISSFISWVKKKLHLEKDVKSKASEVSKKVETVTKKKNVGGEQIAKNVGAKYKHGNKSVEKGGSEALGTSYSFVKYADFGISYHPLNMENINKVLSEQDRGIQLIDKIKLDVEKGTNGPIEYYHKGYAADNGANSDGDMNVSRLKNSLISNREQKIANINMSTINQIADEITKAQQAYDKSESKVNVFDKACMSAQKSINSVKVDRFDSNEQLNKFKKSCTRSVNVTRVVFNNLTTAIKSLAQYVNQMYGVLDKISAVCTTYNITDDSIR